MAGKKTAGHTAKPKHQRDDVVRKKIVADANTIQRAARTNEEQLALIATRRGNSAKERARLNAF